MPSPLSQRKGKFLLDANMRFSVGRQLQAAGYDVHFLAGTAQHDLSDEKVLALACAEQRILITNDTDFGHLVFVAQQSAVGVILFRLDDDSMPAYATKINLLINQYSAQMVNHFIVVTDQHLRIRTLP